MRRRYRYVAAAPVCALLLTLVGCSVEDGPAQPGGPEVPAAAQQDQSPESQPEPQPETVADFLGLAEKAMANEDAWKFAVEGEEGLTLQGQEKTASFEATVRRSRQPDVLHSQGVVTGGDGSTEPEEIFVVGDTAYLKEEGGGWEQSPASAPETRSKVEDPVAVLKRFASYAEASGDAVTLTRTDGTIRLRVALDSRKLPDVRDLAFVQKALREFEPVARQLRDAGVAVDEDRVTVSELRETLVLDAGTYRLRTHRFRFALLLPYGGGDIAFEQDVRTENQGAFSGRMQLPEGVG